MTRPIAEAAPFQDDLGRLQAEPPPRLLRLWPWMAAGLLFGLVLLAGILRVDTVVVAFGRLATTEPPLHLRPAATARLDSLLVRPGDVVAAGDVLARLDPTIPEADLAALLAERDALTARIARLEAELSGADLPEGDVHFAAEAQVLAERRAEAEARRAALAADAAGIAAQIAAAEADAPGLAEQLVTVREVEQMRETLLGLQSGSQLALQEARLVRLRAEAEQRRHTARLAELVDRQARLAAESALFEAGLRRSATEGLAEARPRLLVVEESIAKARALREMSDVIAPRPGVVLRVAEGGPGSLIAAGDAVVILVPSDLPLLAEIGLRSGDAGRVQAGDAVSLKIDAFPWKRHGILTGELADVGPASFVPEGGTEALHPAHVTFDPATLAAGLPPGAALLPGMTLTAEIHTGTRSVLAFFLDPVLRGLSEALREP